MQAQEGGHARPPTVLLSWGRLAEEWARELAAELENQGVRSLAPPATPARQTTVQFVDVDAVVVLAGPDVMGAEEWLLAVAKARVPILVVDLGGGRWLHGLLPAVQVASFPPAANLKELKHRVPEVAARIREHLEALPRRSRADAPPRQRILTEAQPLPEEGPTTAPLESPPVNEEVPGPEVGEEPEAEARTERAGRESRAPPRPETKKRREEARAAKKQAKPGAKTTKAPAPDVPVRTRLDSDAVADKDLIGIERDVEALAQVVCAKDVSPPLSIGLFGDWGSGKSFFIREMQRKVEALSVGARAAAARGEPTAFHGRVAQIEFNAWHYVDGNLWASMVEHVFRRLRVEGEPPEDSKARRRLVSEELEKRRAEVQRAERGLEEARAALRDLERQKEEAARAARENRARQKLFERGGTPPDLAPLARLAASDQDLLARLGVPKEALETVQGLGEAVREARETTGSLLAVGRWLARERGWLATALPPLALFAGVWLAFFLVDRLALQESVHVLLEGLGGLAAGAAALLAPVRAQATRARKTLDRVDAVRKGLEAEARRETETLRAELAKAETTEAERAKDLAQAKDAVALKERELQSLTPARALKDFIESRHQADDYRKHLGVVSMVRADFDRLARLMRDAETDGKDEDEVRPLDARHRIDRIVLYVDDLDRCPPERVVDVLQAIHLLLAFPLFTVVVAVDARWVKAALDRRYSQLLRAGDHDQDEVQDVATSHDYLEKIFQVPFWVPVMTPEAARSLLRGLLDDPESTRRLVPAVPAPPVQTVAPVPHVGGRSGGTPPDAAGQAGPRPGGGTPAPDPSITPGPNARTGGREGVAPDDPKKEPDARDAKPPRALDLNPRALSLTREERALMEALTPLVGRTPRALKRFLNCYRIIRASLPAEALDGLAEGEEISGRPARILLMLAIVVGAPDQSRAIFDGLREANASLALGEWLTEEAPEAPMDDDWRRVMKAFESDAVHRVAEDPVGDFLEDLPLVARFSFNLDPLGAHR